MLIERKTLPFVIIIVIIVVTTTLCLPPDYHCGCASNWSKVYTFTTLGEKDSSPTFAVYGDFGAENAQSLPWLVEEATQGSIHGVLHCGDIAYNLFGVSART